MSPNDTKPVEIRDFRQAFEQMCNFVAVAKTGQVEETIKGLVQVVLLVFPDEQYDKSESICKTIEELFGIIFQSHEIQTALESMEENGVISRPAGTNYVLDTDVLVKVRKNIDDATALESRVKSSWFNILDITMPQLSKTEAWLALQAYLCRTFRRHGMQAAALLDPTISTAPESEASLSSLLRQSVEDHIIQEHRPEAMQALGTFMGKVGEDADRTKYIAHLADGAFNYFMLAIPPELSSQLHQKLNSLTLFLDTNFLFGILDLHDNPQVEVSHNLINAIVEHDLPFKLRYHTETERELGSTIAYYGDRLRSRTWTRSLSRAAVKSENMVGLEKKFHEMNADSNIDINEFLRQYEHLDIILKERGIDIYQSRNETNQEEIDLYEEYREFLKTNRREEKPYATVMHDAKVLHTTRQLRSNSQSSLDAGALFISCDYFLYRFDWMSARQKKSHACVLLPNIFWQILRPYIPTDAEFERAFAETFALPEFRAIGNKGKKACSKMLQILASYKDVPEETAFKMMSNGLLLDQLQAISNDQQFEKAVEAAFVEENRNLLEEKATLQRVLEEQKQLKDTQVSTHIKRAQKAIEEKKKLELKLKEKDKVVVDVKKKIEGVIVEVKQKEGESKHAEQEKQAADVRAFRMEVVAGIAVGIILILVFEGFMHLKPWVWLKTHDKTIPLQIGISSILLLGTVGMFVKKWRIWCWGTGALGFILTLLTLL